MACARNRDVCQTIFGISKEKIEKKEQVGTLITALWNGFTSIAYGSSTHSKTCSLSYTVQHAIYKIYGTLIFCRQCVGIYAHIQCICKTTPNTT